MQQSGLSRWAHAHLPVIVVGAARRARALAFWTQVGLRQWPRWGAMLRTSPRRDGVRVFYGHEPMPGADDVVFGGQVKFQRLDEVFPNDPRPFNVLYLGSTSLPL